MRIDAGISQTYIQQSQQTSNSTPVATQASSSAQENIDEAQPLNKVDFTNMTNQELFDWMNGELKADRMSFEESSPFLLMTINIPVNGEIPAELDNTTRHNFVEKIQAGIEGAKSRNDDELVARLESALKIVQSYQIQPGSIDVRA